MKCRGEVHTKELCMERSDHDMGEGVGGMAKALCVKRTGYREGFETRSVRVRRKKIRRILTKLGGGGGGVQQSYRWRWGDGEV